jgi:hypothetical protein
LGRGCRCRCAYSQTAQKGKGAPVIAQRASP